MEFRSSGNFISRHVLNEFWSDFGPQNTFPEYVSKDVFAPKAHFRPDVVMGLAEISKCPVGLLPR